VVAAAIAKPDEVMVFKTKEAAQIHWEDLKQELQEKGYLEPVGVDIPAGQSKEELWEIFNTLVDAVQEGDMVAFDITHSFRSLPLISFLSVAYLFGRLLEDISRALFANRPFEVMEQTRKLYKYTEGMDERNLLERDVREWAAPFGLLLDNVVSCFSSFTGTPDRGDHPFAAHDFPAG